VQRGPTGLACAVDFGVLGTLSVTDGDKPLSLGGPVQRRLLAALIAHAPHAVSAEVLVDDVWGELAPATAVRTLHSHMARLRRSLGQDSGSPTEIIETIEGSYRLTLARSDLDAWAFEDTMRAATAGDSGLAPEQVSSMLRGALALWRGPAYADFADAPFAEVEVRRLNALRERAIEAAIAADLARGQGAELLPELEGLVLAHPFNEALWSALITAQYRAGRQSDALETYRRARTLLGDELGIDPGPELQALEAKVLAQDPSLLAAAPVSTLVHPCPWKGLASYQSSDAGYFVGRDAEVNEVLARLVDYPVVVVTGPSGSGKSSLVRAGVIPALAQGALIGSSEWRIGLVSTGSDPWGVIRSELNASPDLLVIDPADDAVAHGATATRAFGELLDEAHAQGVRILLTVRADLFGRLGDAGAAVLRSGSSTVLLGTPSTPELRRMVEVPAERVGLAVDPTLVEAVISDVAGRPGCLPLLSTALVRTWERREGARLTVASYLASGGCSSALERLAEECFGSLSEAEQAAARRLLTQLVILDDGRWRRRHLPLVDAAASGDAAAQTALQRLVDARLVSTDEDSVQVTHEALITAWPRMAGWLSDRMLVSSLVGSLTSAAFVWRDGGHEDADLYRGARLQAALELQASHPEEIGPLEHEFIDSGRIAAEREIAALRRGRRRLGYLAASLVLLLVFAVISWSFTVRARDDAQRAALVSDAQRIGLQALGRPDMDQRLLLAVAAVRLHDDPGTRASLVGAIQASDGPDQTVPLAAAARSLAISSDGWVAIAEEDGRIEVLPPDLSQSTVLDPASSWTGGTPNGHVAWLPGHEYLLVGASQPDRVFVMNAQYGGVSVLGDGWNPFVFAASPEGDWAAAPVSEDTVNALRVDGSAPGHDISVDGSPLRMAPGPGTSVVSVEHESLQVIDTEAGAVRSTYPLPLWQALSVSSDGEAAAYVTSGGEVVLLDLVTGESRTAITDVQPVPTVLALSPDADALATAGGADGRIRIWSARDGLERSRFAAGSGRISQMEWSPLDGRLLTTASGTATLQVWDPDRFVDLAWPATAGAPEGHGSTTTTAVDQQGRVLAVGTQSGGPWFVDLDGRQVHHSTQGDTPSIVSVDFADQGRVVVAVDALGALTTWDPKTGRKLDELVAATRAFEDTDLGRAAVSPDGSRAAMSIDGRDLRVIDLADGAQTSVVYPDLGSLSLLRVLSWTPDGRHVVVGTQRIDPATYRRSEPGAWALVEPLSGAVEWATDAPEQTVATAASFVQGGRVIAVPGRSGRPYFLDSATGGLLDAGAGSETEEEATRVARPPTSISATADGRLMAVASESRPVEVWDVETGTPSTVLEVSDETTGAHFLSEGELVTVSSDGQVRLHDLSTSDWIRAACSVAGRELSEAEWARFLPGQPYQAVCAGSGQV
jgi:DNA-binding SARP family transcriptional activator/WD40 repeat protein